LIEKEKKRSLGLFFPIILWGGGEKGGRHTSLR